MVEKIKTKIDSWKAGKFVHLTSRPWSINSYVLSKLWFRSACIDVRKGDCIKMTSAYKTWLYIDNLAKPQEEILYRYPDDRGLGYFNIQWKSQAHLISSFLETVFGDKFLVSPFHKALFDKFVLGEKIKKITRPPYYSEAFFNNIKEALRSQEDIFHWKSGDWYRYLLKKFVTHTPSNNDGELQLIPSRSEIIYPQIDHTNSTRVIRQANLPPRIRTSLFLMKNDILPNKE